MIVEYLGEEEPSLVQFIISKIEEQVGPVPLVEELLPVLDEDAEQFVAKLWRYIIVTAVKAQSGI